MTLRRVPPGAPARPPQRWLPELPVTYRAEQVEFRSGPLTLAGELTVPVGEGPHPGLVLLGGGGAQDRDGNRFQGERNSFYAVIADHLSRRGVAVLRFDDRGVGEYDQATLKDLADDAVAAANYLGARADIDGGRIGLLGYSEGAAVAPLASIQAPAVSLLALLAPEAVPGAAGELERYRLHAETKAPDGRPRTYYVEQFELRRVSLGALLEGADPEEIRRRLRESGSFRPNLIDAHVRWMAKSRNMYKMRHDAGATLSRVRVPILAVYLGKDDLVPQAQNEPAFRAAVAHSGNTDVVVKVFADYDHGLSPPPEPAAPRFPLDYTLPAHDVLQAVSEWLAERFPARADEEADRQE